MVQEPLNPAVLEAARQLLDRTTLRWPDTLQLGAAITARDMFQATEIIFVSASPQLLEAAKSEGFHTIDPAKEAAAVKEEELGRRGRLPRLYIVAIHARIGVQCVYGVEYACRCEKRTSDSSARL